MGDLPPTTWRATFAGLAVMVALLLIGMWQSGDFASAATPKPDPLCIRSGVLHGDQYKVCRAVAQGRLVLLYFVHHGGVWFLIDVRRGADLPSGTPKS